MDILASDLDLSGLPRLGAVDLAAVWKDMPFTEVAESFGLLDDYLDRHDQWTDKIRVMGLDGGLLVDYRTTPALDRLVDYIFNSMGWARPEIYIISNLERKGLGPWAAVSVMNQSRPVMVYGIKLVESLTPQELAFVIGHEAGHLLNYDDRKRRQMSLGFLIREMVEAGRRKELQALPFKRPWQEVYRSIIINSQTEESRCDLLGLLVCGELQWAANALLSLVLKSTGMARKVSLEHYLSVHLPALRSSPQAGPISVNQDHPFMPTRIESLRSFCISGGLDKLKARIY